jgi:hypothetical protein
VIARKKAEAESRQVKMNVVCLSVCLSDSVSLLFCVCLSVSSSRTILPIPYIQLGNMFECGCCFGEVIFEDLVQCSEVNQ